ncbi:cupin domain-containing protein [Yoonia vestfoldensis]|uniref:cupin domain-containing protein n=1 Tax=Yoonia vestfoldensis TaxID=245188 RepID=UPI0003A8298A|nr:cupin domain-containing protein [Yoonia vestfoldensis]
MPVIKAQDAILDQPTDTHPVIGTYTARLFSDTGGLTQFGAFTETLPPGSRSSLRHWHQQEDEMIFMLAGEVVVHEGPDQTKLLPGDAACFKAGSPRGHFLENASQADATYLVIGTRAPRDQVTYPDHDRILHLDRTDDTRCYTTFAGATATTPY